jgi:hypothetical protein
MTHDELERQEEANRDLIETLGKLSRDVRASPGFVARTMARADRHQVAREGRFGWVNLWGSTPRLGVRVAVAVGVMLALIGAVPQYLTWINAYLMGVPADTVHEARLQEHLWEKNFVCATQLHRGSNNYAVISGEEVMMVAWACPSGDVLVTLESTADAVSRRSVWIPLSAGTHTVGFLDHLVQEAFAANPVRLARRPTTPMVTVLCQKWLPNRFIVRRVQLANGRCFDEVINPRTGEVKQRREAPCDRNC